MRSQVDQSSKAIQQSSWSQHFSKGESWVPSSQESVPEFMAQVRPWPACSWKWKGLCLACALPCVAKRILERHVCYLMQAC